ncbi:hypothetical protein CCY99_05395 [Helicobacter sp. 16-1353]|uniref:ATP-binding protein n=1 Tax=Helicobacter sp. 16-1353 TaxID=2004996 RepID=UPI000DCE8EF7|nr:ATP-binding protein [Helicobacter sp. 16-1353]RAX53818.1 hypothetical protein CCY99_05395 [Helicobacter sp. 16-1353]
MKIKKNKSITIIALIILLLGVAFVTISALLFKNIKEDILLIDIKNSKQNIENINKNMSFWINEKINLLNVAPTLKNIQDSKNINNIKNFMESTFYFDDSFDILQILYEDKHFYIYHNAKLFYIDANKITNDINPYNLDWYKKTKNTLKPNIYIVEQHGRLHKTTMNISVPIIYNDKFIGVLAGVIVIDDFLEKFSNNLAFNDNIHMFIIKNNNIIFPNKINPKIKDAITTYILNPDIKSDYFFTSNLDFDIGKIGFYINNEGTANYLNKLFTQEVFLMLFFIVILGIIGFLHKLYSFYINKRLLNTKQLTDIYLDKKEQGLILLDKNYQITFINKIAKKILSILNINDIFTFLQEGSEMVTYKNKSWIINKIPLYQYGYFQGGIISIEDITEKENLKKEKQKNEYILMHQAKMIEMGELVGGINHQLKQPLNGISILIGNIIDFEKNNMLTKELLLQNLKYCTDRIKMLDDTINLYSNYYNSQINIKYFNLYNCIENVINIINITKNIGGYKKDIKIHGNKTLMLYSLENIISQIILILLSNANDAVQNKQNKTILIEFAQQQDNIIISVTDYGIGIDKNLRNDLFNEIKTTKAKGVGIGLYFAKKLANDKLQGDLYITSYENPTIFVLKIKKELKDINK